MRKFIIIFFYFYGALFLLDGIVSVLDETWVFFSSEGDFMALRSSIAYSVLLLSCPYLMLIFFSDNKKNKLWILAPFYITLAGLLHMFTIVLYANEAPGVEIFLMHTRRNAFIQSHMGFGVAGWSISFLQIVIGFFLCRSLFQHANQVQYKEIKKNLFSKSLAALFVPFLGFFFFIFIQIAAIPVLLTSISANFLNTDGARILSNEKIFIKGNKVIRLIPMVHVGKESFYKDILKDFSDKKTLFLMEGVQDKKELLNKLSYKKIADSVGLEEQREHFDPMEAAKKEGKEENVKVVSADLDASDFDKKTIKYLNQIGAILDFKDLSSLELLLGKGPDFKTPEGTVFDDILTKRNDYLMKVFNENVAEYDIVIIPWGALHLPDIEKRLIYEGYVFSKFGESRVTVDLLSWFSSK